MKVEVERWEVLDQAVARLWFKVSAATPGSWWRPLRLNTRVAVLADVPQDEQLPHPKEPNVATVVVAPSLTNGRFQRKRSGRDLEYIAMMDPTVGKALADLLHAVSDEMKEGARKKTEEKDEPESWGAALKVAQRIVGTGHKKRYGE